MAQNIVNNLFGIDPEALQQQRAAIDSANAFRFAQLDPLERANMAIYQGSAGIGRGVNQLLGGDEQLNTATKVRELASQFDMTSVEGIDQFAKAVSPFAPNVAQAAIQRRNDLITKRLQQGKLLSETGKLDEETRLAGREIKEVGVKGNPELVQKAVLDKDGNIISLVGEPYSRFSQKTSIDARNIGPKNVLAIDQKDAEDILKNRNSLERSIPLLESSIAQLDKGIIGGTFSDSRTALLTGLASAGIKDPKITQYLASTKTFNANRIELATAIAKQLGVNPTDRDFQASLDRFAAASENPASSKIFLTEMTALKKLQLKDANDALNFYRKNEGSFAGYDRPLPKAFSGTESALSGLSTEQLKQEIQKLKNPAPKQ
jgi:hypothetical protein